MFDPIATLLVARRYPCMASLLDNTEGATVVEGIVVIPVLCIVLMATLLVHRVLVAKQKQQQRGRVCAWTVVNGGCKERNALSCQQVSVADLTTGLQLAGSEGDDAIGALRQLQDDSPTTGVTHIADFLGGLLGLGRGIDVRTETEVKVPAFLGGNSIRVGCRFQLLCNEADPSPFDIFTGSVCAMTGGHIGC